MSTLILCYDVRLDLLNGKNQSASDRLSTSEDRRQTIETAFETSSEKIEALEAQVRPDP